MSDTVEKTADGAIVYDPEMLNQISAAAFDAGGWENVEPVIGAYRSAGRGNTLYVDDGIRQYVLRHYIRGGLPGRLLRDVYLWRGERETRSFQEWYLLAKLRKRGLPVPKPAAARYRRFGLWYRADLITERIPGIRSLAGRIAVEPGSRDFWAGIGKALFDFHAAGVCHADLNAYNIQVDEDDRLWLLDFDRGSIREPGVWRQKNLARLHRSLRKLKSLDKHLNFTRIDWNTLLEGYFSASRSA